MKKTPQPAPANPSGGEQPKKRLRPVYLTDEVWAALRETGNASHALNQLCEKAGYGKPKTI